MTNNTSNRNPILANPWLNHPLHRSPDPAPSASFIEYLRWMRIRRDNPNNNSQIGLVNNGEVLELFQKLQNKSDYASRLNSLTQRTRRLATVCFEVKTTWRIRVGGMKGPESILLPAFDALGMPYIPSTTLKGVAREMAERDSEATLEDIRQIFGDLEPTACMGKVTFLDAYPLPFLQENPNSDDEAEGLVPDMANSIWTWDQHDTPQYKTNPNVFLSLRKPIFVIGLRVTSRENLGLLERVKKWLLKGLTQGIGSRVNSGYGVLEEVQPSNEQEKPKKRKSIVKVQFKLQGQLIHGRQKFDKWQQKRNQPEWKPPGVAQPEVRPPAFRSMLRYWFRTLALGVLEPQLVRNWELTLFGGIEPQARMGVFQLEIPDGKVKRDNAENDDDDFGLATGTLILRQSYLMQQLSEEQRTTTVKLIQSLSWLMFHLGGVGLGARRPCYSRQDRDSAPWWRGSTITFRDNDQNWRYSSSLEALQIDFRKYLNTFYTSLSALTGQTLQLSRPRTASMTGNWAEAVDSNCRILCVEGSMHYDYDKPPALALLHREATREGNGYNRQLCGSMNERSPIWIARINNRFDVVTIFGIDNSYRQRYFKLLTKPDSSVTDVRKIWPISQAF
ncbi:MAG: RAMP superfamily CRISPR-associated protein [Scytonema sp. PMC 1069.18]|nr:RAMP superfamily CRISPR-associated protein [Scytonema sp. PMC 1069.18]MEC4881072.1 RAMP superfamily CRISPR-associated protein [Scytonema sp. PMC 1070.18]